MKNKITVLNCLLALVLLLHFFGCVKKGRDQVLAFLNAHIKNWMLEENALLNKYNAAVTARDFTNNRVYELIQKDINPALIRLRKKANDNKPVHHPDLKNIVEEFINKLDFLMEGFSKIEEGMLKQNTALINEGRQSLQKYSNVNKSFLRSFQQLLEDYKIELKQRG